MVRRPQRLTQDGSATLSLVVPGPASRTSRFRPRIEDGWDSGRGEKQGKMTALSLLMVDLPHAFSNPSLVSTCAGRGRRVGWEIMARVISHVQVLFSNERVAVPSTPRLDFDYSKIAEGVRGPGVRRGERGRGNELESDDHGDMSQLPSHQCHACVSGEGEVIICNVDFESCLFIRIIRENVALKIQYKTHSSRLTRVASLPRIHHPPHTSHIAFTTDSCWPSPTSPHSCFTPERVEEDHL